MPAPTRAVRRRDLVMLCTAAATGLSPPTNSRVSRRHGGRPVDGILPGGAAARPGAGREHHRVSPGKQPRDLTGRGRLQVADDRFGAGLAHLGHLGRVPDQPHGLIAPPGQEPLKQERDLPVPARDHDAHAAGRVRDAIATLPSGQRDAVLLSYLQGLSHREAAAELGTKAPTRLALIGSAENGAPAGQQLDVGRRAAEDFLDSHPGGHGR